VGIVIASQRPGELSETALSQCNTLIVHRLVNPIDKNIVRCAVSIIDEDALKLLPSLGPRQAIVLGEAVNIPARITINELPPKKAT
jgi:DNA helicase HerA-like ATPase